RGQRFGKDANQQRDVRGAAGDRAGHAEFGLAEHAGRGWNVSAERNEAVGRLVPEYAAEVGRDADRSADVAAELERGEAGRDGARGSAGGAAYGAVGIPGVATDPVDGVEGLPVAGAGGEVGLAEDVGAGLAQQGHGIGIPSRKMVA